MSIAEFVIEWREFGLGVALHNALFTFVHRHDAHVRTWGYK